MHVQPYVITHPAGASALNPAELLLSITLHLCQCAHRIVNQL